MTKDEPAYLEDYVTVNERVGLFQGARGACEDGAVRARCIDDDGKTVRFAACVHRDGAPCQLAEQPGLLGYCLNADGTGSAEEVRGIGYVNKTSAPENCETSAIGRALAMAGIAVEKSVVSKDEIELAQAERNRQEREEAPEVEVEMKRQAAEKTASGNGEPAQPIEALPVVIGEKEARTLVEECLKVTDLDRLRLGASVVMGTDPGDCSTVDKAVKALSALAPPERDRLLAKARERASA